METDMKWPDRNVVSLSEMTVVWRTAVNLPLWPVKSKKLREVFII
jgi:hypothetical protein